MTAIAPHSGGSLGLVLMGSQDRFTQTFSEPSNHSFKIR